MSTLSTAVWSDIDIELTRQNDGDITRDTEINAIKNSLANIINTLQGSRRMLQPFASDVQGLLFEPIDAMTARSLAEKLLEGILYWEDRVSITNFDIEPKYDMNQYECRLNFTIKPSNIVETVKFIINR